jgi:hypothetical protein
MAEDTKNTNPQQNIDGNEMLDYSRDNNRYPEFSPTPVDKRPLIIGGIVAVVILVMIVLIGVYLFFNPATAQVVRDIVIIFLGLSSFLILIGLIILVMILLYLTLKINDLVQLFDREIKPLLHNIQQTSQTVRGTTTFISNKAAQPIIATVSSIAAVKAIFSSLFRR